jgi:hypothetical protein
MKYSFHCDSCGVVSIQKHSPKDFKTLKESGSPCTTCGVLAHYVFDPQGVQVCFKGDSWADKNFKEKSYRNNRSKVMANRQNQHHHVPKLAPNYKGEQTSSWKEARAEAQADGKFSETYDHLVHEEDSK